MGNSNSARRQQSRSVPTSPEVRLRFSLKSSYTLDNSRRFNTICYFLNVHTHTHTHIHTRTYIFFYGVIVNFYCYLGFLDPPYTLAVSQIYRPRLPRDFINCKIHLLPTVSTYYLHVTWIWVRRENFYNNSWSYIIYYNIILRTVIYFVNYKFTYRLTSVIFIL